MPRRHSQAPNGRSGPQVAVGYLRRSTAAVTAAVRHLEGTRSHPLFFDPDASRFLSSKAEQDLAATMQDIPFFDSLVGVRYGVFESLAAKLLASGCVRQFLSLGAGFCTRARRFAERYEAPFLAIEADQVSVLARKLGTLQGYPVPLVPVDLVLQYRELPFLLAGVGHVASEPTLFHLEGVLYYFPNRDAILGFLRVLRSIAAPQSRLLFDVHVGVCNNPKLQGALRQHSMLNEFLPQSEWAYLLEEAQWSVLSFSNLTELDESGRLYAHREDIRSSVFLASPAAH